ncbi:MAG TPA: type IA DNA topoisomerase [Longimicrobiales bacterium]|nr:type IA DNA topoisomerase [Longimicrobiales bacterium]
MNILIVESAAKARTLQKYLGADWSVLATGGHVETLPDDRSKHGKDAKKAYWANRPDELPTPPWVWTDRGEAAVEKILDEAGTDPVFWIATDPDREGEFIAWCLERILSPRGPTRRVTFQEVTEEAVREALEHPRGVDQRMVDSALVRKFLDRLVGFRTSKMASTVVGRGASMGRVQTPTLGFVVEKELEREAFVPTPYFEVRARAEAVDFQVRFHEKGDPEIWRDESGRESATRTFDGELAERARASLEEAGELTLTDVTSRTNTRKPSAPFSTDALLQVAGTRLGWSPRKTSALASLLYEDGHVTYIRTDSTRLSASAVQKARSLVREGFGEDHLGPEARGNVAKGPVQDAHEAIRPTRLEVDEAPVDDADARKLYRLIRAHTLASQMAPSVSASRSIEAACKGLDRPLTGTVSWRTFLGWEAAYREFEPERPTAPPPVDLTPGAVWSLDAPTDEQPNPLLVEDETRPPGRYRPHTLIRAMKDAGIGRPSTYSRTVEKLEGKGYVEMEDGALVPTARGRAVWLDAAPLYAQEGRNDASTNGTDGGGASPSSASSDGDAPRGPGVELFSTEFTAAMEEGLDEVARGETPAPARWEDWRDKIRTLHEAALAQKKAGGATVRQQRLLARILENASPDDLPADARPEDPSALTYQEAQTLIQGLREAGVQPAPSEAQLTLIRRLLEDLELEATERDEVLGEAGVEGLRTSGAASRVIDELQRLHDERQPPSPKQRSYIESLMEDADVSAEEAAGLAGVDSLEDLTGGREGSASRLIEELLARTGKGNGDG